MDANEIIWRPDPETASRTRIARFMRAHGLAVAHDPCVEAIEHGGEVGRGCAQVHAGTGPDQVQPMHQRGLR